MEVILQVAELRTERRVWRDLIVRNFYAPDPSSLDARLVRDSSVRLKGEQLGIRDQVALRGIFTKLFGNNDEFSLIPAELAEHPGLADLAITQFVVRDGWVGVAVGLPRSRTTVGEGDDTALDREARWPIGEVR
jgi:hypothetical protein